MSNTTLEQLDVYRTGKVSDNWWACLTADGQLFVLSRQRPVRLLEVGLQNGGSLKFESNCFLNANSITGCNISRYCSRLDDEQPHIRVIVYDANAPYIQSQVTRFEVTIDGGSHHSRDIVKTFALYFTSLAEAGLFNTFLLLTLFKRISDLINHKHWGLENSRGDLPKESFAKYPCELDELALSQIHSFEFTHSTSIVCNTAHAESRLGDHIFNGERDIVVPFQHLQAKGIAYQANPQSDESQKPRSARPTPPTDAIEPIEAQLRHRQAELVRGLTLLSRS